MRPAEMLDHKADLLVRLERPDVRRAWVGQLAMDYGEGKKRGLMTDAEARSNAAGHLAVLSDVVPEAEAFHVNEDMTSLIQYAASQLEETDRIDRTIVPTSAGIVRFEGGMPYVDVRGQQLRISWAVWGPIMARTSKTGEPQEWTSLWLFNDHFIEPDSIAHRIFDEHPNGEEWVRKIFGRWGFLGSEMMQDGVTLGPAWREPDEAKAAEVLAEGDTPTGYTNPIRLLHAFFLMLGQTSTTTHPADLDRATRKRSLRRGLPARVTIVRLREPKTARAEGESQVQWNHRWLVRGFWRWQVCGPHHPLAQEIEPGKYRARIWIAPFVKGPSDRPLVVSQKVYTVHE